MNLSINDAIKKKGLSFMDSYSDQVKQLIEFVKHEYAVNPEFLWPERSPNYFVLRNPRTKKWFAIIMIISGAKIKHSNNPKLEVINFKFDKGQALDFAENNKFIYPGYHMNKRNWITIPLDNSLETGQILELLEHSYELSDICC